MDDPKSQAPAWIKAGKVRARLHPDGAIDVRIDGLTTQTKYYKPLLRDFFRKEARDLRPRYGDVSVHIRMEYIGDPPHMDIDNLAKALLDSACGAVFHDDSQVARLLVERVASEREGVSMRIETL